MFGEGIEMLDVACDPREVKACFLLADAMNHGPFDPIGYHESLTTNRSRIAQRTEQQLDQEIRDPERRVRYNGGKWRLAVVELSKCSVWPQMGSRPWARGPVSRVARELQTYGRSDDRLNSMARVVQLSFADLPLIVFRRKRTAEQFRIDDGCHRAVAYYVAGFRQAFVFIGEYQGQSELTWAWDG